MGEIRRLMSLYYIILMSLPHMDMRWSGDSGYSTTCTCTHTHAQNAHIDLPFAAATIQGSLC